MRRLAVAANTVRTCERCGAVFVSTRHSAGRFCSRACWRAAIQHHTSCAQCGKTFCLREKRTRFCGQRCAGAARRIHGHTSHGISTPEYRCYQAMLTRCYNRHDKRYASYGGRGISVCERWRASFAAFLDDMGTRPSWGTLERIDNDGNYEPGNVRWATWAEQSRNKTTSRKLTYRGQTLTVAEWAREVGIGASTITARISKFGWSVEDALSRKDGLRSTAQPRTGARSERLLREMPPRREGSGS